MPNPSDPWELTDGVVSIRPPRPGEAAVLVAGRDAESRRWLGPGDNSPRPTACVLVEGNVVGWVDYDSDQAWLKAAEVNVGYNIFPPQRRRGYAARAVTLLVQHLAMSTGIERAYLAIDAENAGSLGVARAVGAREVERYRNENDRPNIRYVLDVGR
jgi:RimJ/RimL family protein N-acetyltransferase